MSKETLSLSAMLLGLVLLAASFWWGNSQEPPSSWSEADAQKYQDTSGSLHEAVFKVRRNSKPPKPGDSPAVSPEELEALQKTFDEQKSELDSARHGRKYTSWIMRGVGIVLTVGGLFGHKIGSE